MTPALHFTQFGKYEIIRKLGRSMTDVYLALDPEADRRVVLKIVEQCRDALTELVVDAERRGAMIQQQLHALDARILEVYEHGERDGCFFLAMQYAEGRSLAEVIRKDTRIEARRAARYCAEICSQLQTLHSFQAEIDGQKRAVVHGDIKPHNIQIGSSGEVWLLDFGIAKAITATRNLTQHNLGSPAYCSPERIKSGNVDPFSDLWAAGVSLYEMVAGMPPYQAHTTRKLENLIQSRRPPRALPDDCPAALKGIIWKALAADPARRYPTAVAFGEDLHAFLDGKRTTAEDAREPAWDANATVEKARSSSSRTVPRPSAAVRTVSRRFGEFKVVAWSLIAGLVIGLVCFIPASHLYRFWNDSAPLRAGRDYAKADASVIESDWKLYQRLDRTHTYFNRYALASYLADPLAGRLAAAGEDVIEDYRNSTDSPPERFDWAKARTALAHAVELRPASAELRGQLALCDGYLKLDASPDEALERFREAASLSPKSPDPHLALARLYVYHLHNEGQAIAEFQAAERLGHKLAPREMEQQGDVYLHTAIDEYQQWVKASATVDQRRLLPIMQGDFDRARALFEPIRGYSNVNHSLERVYRFQASVEAISQDREKALLVAATRKSRPRRWR
ncbi:MAG: protein kinase [Acidobacteria bacterium]|nr:protein kinase [Acidobacteriota bacterium]